MFSNWKIGQRLTAAFTLTIVLLGVVAAAGFWGLTQMVTTVSTILGRDAKLMEHASDLEAKTLNLRRYEKDVFLNIGDKDKVAEYAAKWQQARSEAGANLLKLHEVGGADDEATIQAMRRGLATRPASMKSCATSPRARSALPARPTRPSPVTRTTSASWTHSRPM